MLPIRVTAPVGRGPSRAADQGRRDPEPVGTIIAIAMQKTGTLTEGKPQVAVLRRRTLIALAAVVLAAALMITLSDGMS